MAARIALTPSMLLALAGPAAAQAPLTVDYAMAIAGFPIGVATLALAPSGSSTTVSIVGRVGGPIDLGRMAASAIVAPGQVSATSRSGSGKDAASADLLSRGKPGESTFTYDGVTGRGPGRIAMTVAGSRVTALDARIPDNPTAVRVPVTDAHKAGIVDPLSLVGMLVQPGGTFRPDGLCGRRHAVFTGQTRFDVAGTPVEARPPEGLPEGYSALGCRVTVTPVSGHRIDKGQAARPRTANLVFARSLKESRTVLWSLSVPAIFGAFTLTAQGLK